MLHPISKTAFVKTSFFDSTESNGLVKAIRKHALLPIECKIALMKCMTLQTLQAQEVLLEAGQINDKFYWVETGLVRFYTDTDVTAGFCSEGNFFCEASSFFSQKPSIESICAEETTVLLSVGYADLQQLFGSYPDLSHAFCILYGQLLEVQHARAALLRYRTPLKRYEAFLALHPQLPNRLLVKHIASYLGIHRVTLCKIRKQLAQKKA
jgi:CRP/FNR family transcriptional regulator, anaerobic regulatory protein